MQLNIEQVPKPCDVDADPVPTWGRLILNRKRAKKALNRSTGAVMTACVHQEIRSNTGSPNRRGARFPNQTSARNRLGRMGWRIGPYDLKKRVMPLEERGLSSREAFKEARARRLA